MPREAGDIYQSKGARANETFKKMEQFRKNAVMMDAIEDYKEELRDKEEQEARERAEMLEALGSDDEDIDIDALLDEDDGFPEAGRSICMWRLTWGVQISPTNTARK